MKKPRILLIIPAYNEEESILHTVAQVKNFSHSPDYILDFLVINDGSSDRTGSLCQEHGYPCVNLVQNLGIGGAVQTGYLYAKRQDYDIAVQFDGDGQHDIHFLDTLVTPLLRGESDFCVGSRFLENNGFRSTLLRRIGIRYLSVLLRGAAGIQVTDPTSGFRAASRQAVQYLSAHYPVDYPEPESLVLLKQNGFRITEVPVEMFARSAGTSSIGIRQAVYYMAKVTISILCDCLFGRNRTLSAPHN